MASKPRVLLVDDDPILRELAEAKLIETGYEVSHAQHGKDALEILKKMQVDVVISDLFMPEMDGFELTKTLRSDPAFHELPVIVITASESSSAVDKAFAAGATSFLPKPVNWTLFGQAVKFVLRASDNQKELRVARDRAKAGEEFKDSLMSVMTHELRTPLNAIIGFGQLIGDRCTENNDVLYSEYAEYIVTSGRRLLGSISDMLLASEARAGEISIDESEITIGELFDQAFAQSIASMSERNADVLMKVEDRNQLLYCDHRLVSRCLAKLMDNCVKFAPSGVKIAAASAIRENGELMLMIKDNGPGVSEQKRAAMEMTFGQIDMSAARENEGLGLGLPLARAIVGAHGGKMEISSVENEGTCIKILFPSDRCITSRSVCQQTAS